uniref:Uncharacterized protein n=1 Tax=Rhizophora mucronata TaxID=61149 RepID=A0A2P2QY17_RHIMU
MEQPPEEEQLERVGSLPETDLASTSPVAPSVPTAEVSRTTTSSGDISTTSGSSGEIPAAILLESSSLLPTDADLPGLDEPSVAVPTAARHKCVGKNARVSWGSTSMTGRRKEMEDAVAVVPAFMSRACYHVGGCTASGSSSSSEISPIHFFGVYDGHGGSQVFYILLSAFLPSTILKKF